MARWDLGVPGGPLTPNVTYTLALVDGVPSSLEGSEQVPFLVFVAQGNLTSVRADTGALLWFIPDPVQ